MRIANARLLIAEQKFEECLRELETLEQDFAGQSVTAVYLGCVHDGLVSQSWQRAGSAVLGSERCWIRSCPPTPPCCRRYRQNCHHRQDL